MRTGTMTVAVLATLALAGCGGSDPTPVAGSAPPPGPSTTSATPSARPSATGTATSTTKPSPGRTSAKPSASTSSKDPSRKSSARPAPKTDSSPAVVGYRKYVAAVDTMSRSGGAKTAQLPGVATGVQLKSVQDQAKAYRQWKFHTTGATKIVWADSADVTGQPDRRSVRACYDTTNAQPVDAKGNKATKPGAPTRWLDEIQMQRVGKAWKAASSRSRATSC